PPVNPVANSNCVMVITLPPGSNCGGREDSKCATSDKIRLLLFRRRDGDSCINEEGGGPGDEESGGAGYEDDVPTVSHGKIAEDWGSARRAEVAPHVSPAQHRTYVLASHVLHERPQGGRTHVGRQGYDGQSDDDWPGRVESQAHKI